MSNIGRILTLVVKIEDAEQAKAIWDTHLKGGLLSGFRVNKIADGDSILKTEQLIDELVDTGYDREDFE
jgi:hypothetical protein